MTFSITPRSRSGIPHEELRRRAATGSTFTFTQAVGAVHRRLGDAGWEVMGPVARQVPLTGPGRPSGWPGLAQASRAPWVRRSRGS